MKSVEDYIYQYLDRFYEVKHRKIKSDFILLGRYVTLYDIALDIESVFGFEVKEIESAVSFWGKINGVVWDKSAIDSFYASNCTTPSLMDSLSEFITDEMEVDEDRIAEMANSLDRNIGVINDCILKMRTSNNCLSRALANNHVLY